MRKPPRPPNAQLGAEQVARLRAALERLGFFDWVLTAAPIVFLMFIALCVILILLNRPETRRLEGAEDIHSWVEARLRERIGVVGGDVDFAAAPGGGAQLDIWVPVEAET